MTKLVDFGIQPGHSAKNNPLLDAMVRHAIGYDAHFFEQVADVPNFPPHNIDQLDEGVYRLTLAVSGFSANELDVILQNDLLTVSGRKADALPVGKSLYRGIAFRDFTRQFKVGDHVQVANASLEQGLLIINLVRVLPENLKPRRIVID